jgi:hypothetical protein
VSASTKKDVMTAVTRSYVNSIPIAPSGTPDAFVQFVSEWLGRWWRLRDKWKQVDSGYCAIICDPQFDAQSSPKAFERLDLFREAPTAAMGSSIYVTDEVLGKVWRKKGSFSDADAIVGEITKARLSTKPAVLFEPEIGRMLLATEGVKGPLTVIQLGTFSAALTIANVDKQLNSLYSSTLKYPTYFPQIWFNPSKFIPIFKAEKLFQSIAIIHLRATAQDSWFVRSEDDNNAGRTDISISTLNPSCVFVLEIKVLKSFKYNAKSHALTHKDEENIAWALEGLTQVCGYRIAQNANVAFLLLYDMRQTDQSFDAVNKSCEKENVLPRRYFIYNATAAKINKLAKRKP